VLDRVQDPVAVLAFEVELECFSHDGPSVGSGRP
jgi:hypothetical protein